MRGCGWRVGEEKVGEEGMGAACVDRWVFHGEMEYREHGNEHLHWL